MGFPLLLVTEERLRLPSEELEIEYSQATGSWTRNTKKNQLVRRCQRTAYQQ
jgi:hypothetical protein